MPAATILLIDDDPMTALNLSQVLVGSGHAITGFKLGALKNQQCIHRIDVQLDLEIDAEAFRQVIVRFSPGAQVLVLTGEALVEFDSLQRAPIRLPKQKTAAPLEATLRLS